MAKVTKKPVRRKGNTVTIDFAGVKSGGLKIPEGRYKAKITNVEQKEGQESGEPYSELTWEITSEKCNGREVRFDNYSHQPQALWRLKGLLEALGVEVPDGEHEIDWDEIISDETECIVELTDQKSNEGDRTYSRVTGWDTLDSGNTVDDEEEAPPARKPRKSQDEDDPAPRRGKPSKEPDADDDDDEPPTTKKVRKGAKVKFKDEKSKLRKGVILSIDGDSATVETDDGEDSYEMDLEELTVIG